MPDIFCDHNMCEPRDTASSCDSVRHKQNYVEACTSNASTMDRVGVSTFLAVHAWQRRGAPSTSFSFCVSALPQKDQLLISCDGEPNFSETGD